MIDFEYIDDPADAEHDSDEGNGWYEERGNLEDRHTHSANGRHARRNRNVSHRSVTSEGRAGAMLALLERPEWHDHAACRGVSGFFDLPAEQAAERCAVCPVTDECRTAGLKAPYGVWDGEEKPGLEPVADELADRIVDLVTVRPYALTAKGIEAVVRGAAVKRIRATLKRLVVEGQLEQYEARKPTSRGSVGTILYGPGVRS